MDCKEEGPSMDVQIEKEFGNLGEFGKNAYEWTMMFGPDGAEHGKKGDQPSNGKDVGGKGEERIIEKKRYLT